MQLIHWLLRSHTYVDVGNCHLPLACPSTIRSLPSAPAVFSPAGRASCLEFATQRKLPLLPGPSDFMNPLKTAHCSHFIVHSIHLFPLYHTMRPSAPFTG
jgi:hypothetical protein